MATTDGRRVHRAAQAAVSQRSSEQFRRDWNRAITRIARRDRAILNGLAAHDRGEYRVRPARG